MINPNRPVGGPGYPPANTYAPNQGTVPGPGPQNPAPEFGPPGQPPAQGRGAMQVVKDIVAGIVNFFRKLFGGGEGQGGPTSVNPGGPGSLANVDDVTLSQQFGIINTPANVAAFRQVFEAQRSENGVIGPGSPDKDTVGQLQNALTQLGFQVPITGEFDQQTSDAIMKFKTATGLTEPFKFANGQAGVTPFVDKTARTKLAQMLGIPLPEQGPAPSYTPPPAIPTPTQNYTPQAGPNVFPPAPLAPPLAPPVSPAPPPLAPPTIPSAPYAPQVAPSFNAPGALTTEEHGIAAQAGILPTKANFEAFVTAAKAIETSTEVIGPGMRDTPDTVGELQNALTVFGYPVPQTRVFDAATVAAVIRFKRDQQITYPYQMADGSAGVHPYIDGRTLDVIAAKLKG